MARLHESVYLGLLVFVLRSCVVLSQNQCTTKQSCGDCLKESNCVWCSQPRKDVKTVHCKSKLDNPGAEWCPVDKIVDPKSDIKTVLNKPLQTSGDEAAVQIAPQVIDVQLRVGEEFSFNFSYAQAENYPVDLYFLMDLSASMENHRVALSDLGAELAREMEKLTKNVKLGFGSFVDKVEMPFTSTVPSKLKSPCTLPNKVACAPPYSFKNHLSLTENITDFVQKVRRSVVSGNLDSPEGGLDGLMQAMVCTKEIGWRDKARHMIIFSTDATFHIAGDGKLAGIVEPNDGLCHMENNMYTHSLLQDYPSVGHINAKAKENNKVILFAVTEYGKEIYTALKQAIKDSEVGLLKGDSSNVVQLVKKVYEGIVDSVTISDTSDNDIDVQYHSSCVNNDYVKTRICNNLPVGITVNFTATIKAKKCGDNNSKVFQVKPGALDEYLTVNVKTLCECECEKPGHPDFRPNSPACTFGGNLQCGVCNCNEGKFGDRCECNGTSSSDKGDLQKCKKDNSSDVCSGLGSCVCGQCRCHQRPDPSQMIHGAFCECKNYTCEMKNGQLCSSNGACDCGACVCYDGWTGSACDCSTRQDRCFAPDNNLLCSGQGECKCGKCECQKKDGHTYTGQYCNECPTCPSQCESMRPCIECRVHGHDGVCEDRCLNFDLALVDKIDTQDVIETKEKLCYGHDTSNCNFVFKLIFEENGKFSILAEKTKTCNKSVDVLAVVASVIGSIILAGVILLFMWKILTTMHDRREFAKFENERKNANWSRGENPLFKTPLQTFQNPAYSTQQVL